jgi:oxaloacetate decarboxylase alpha subunit
MPAEVLNFTNKKEEVSFMVKEAKPGTVSGNDTLQLVDETLRDGTQSLWGMMMSYHMIEPVLGEIAEAGYYSINGPWHGAQPMISARFFNEDPGILYGMFREKLKNSDTNVIINTMGMMMFLTSPPENKATVRISYGVMKDLLPNINQASCICCTRDEIKNEFPILYPMFRAIGIEPIPYFAIGHGPRHTDEFYGAQVKEVAEKFKPISLCIKDVDGLLTSERLRTLIPAMQKNANGIPLEFHAHGMNGLHTYNATVAMELGVRRISTCVPPLAYSSSHPSAFDIVRNAEELGIKHNIDVEKLKVVSERLTKIGKAFGHPVDNYPLPFDLTYYKHQIPGGVISNTTTQLAALGIPEKLQEVLDEIPRILEELGHPIMITPFSQYIVTQAVLNVQLGRWEQCIDSMVEHAAGLFGIEDAGLPDMDPNLKDKLLSLPQAKKIKERADHIIEHLNSEPSAEELKKNLGLPPDASDEDFVLTYILMGEAMKNITPGGPDSYKKYL